MLVGRGRLFSGEMRAFDHFIEEMRIIIQVLMNFGKARMSGGFV